MMCLFSRIFSRINFDFPDFPNFYRFFAVILHSFLITSKYNNVQ